MTNTTMEEQHNESQPLSTGGSVNVPAAEGWLVTAGSYDNSPEEDVQACCLFWGETSSVQNLGMINT